MPWTGVFMQCYKVRFFSSQKHEHLYIYIPGCHPPKGVVKTRHARVYRDITLPSTSAPCLFVGEYTEEGLPKSLPPSLLSPFMNHTDYSGTILVALITGLNEHKIDTQF